MISWSLADSDTDTPFQFDYGDTSSPIPDHGILNNEQYAPVSTSSHRKDLGGSSCPEGW